MATDSIDYSSWTDLGDENQQKPLLTNENSSATTTLEFQLKESLYSKLKADDTNSEVSSGDTMHKDLPRMESVLAINGKSIDIVDQLYKKHESLVQKLESRVSHGVCEKENESVDSKITEFNFFPTIALRKEFNRIFTK